MPRATMRKLPSITKVATTKKRHITLTPRVGMPAMPDTMLKRREKLTPKSMGTNSSAALALVRDHGVIGQVYGHHVIARLSQSPRAHLVKADAQLLFVDVDTQIASRMPQSRRRNER